MHRLAIAAVLALASPALADTAPPAAPSQALASTEQVHHLMQTMHMEQNMGLVMEQVATGFSSKSGNAAADKDAALMRTAIMDQMRLQLPKMLATIEEIYSHHLTSDEVQAMDNFYQSPAAQSAMAKMPALTREVIPTTMQFMPDVLRGAVGDYCRRKGCTPTERSALANAVETAITNMKARVSQ
jgi:hypothetical protein